MVGVEHGAERGEEPVVAPRAIRRPRRPSIPAPAAVDPGPSAGQIYSRGEDEVLVCASSLGRCRTELLVRRLQASPPGVCRVEGRGDAWVCRMAEGADPVAWRMERASLAEFLGWLARVPVVDARAGRPALLARAAADGVDASAVFEAVYLAGGLPPARLCHVYRDAAGDAWACWGEEGGRLARSASPVPRDAYEALHVLIPPSGPVVPLLRAA